VTKELESLATELI